MRLLIGVVVVMAFVPRAFADDLDAMFGPPSPADASWYAPQAAGANWRGFYFGGQFSYSDASADFSKATQSPIAFVLRNSALEDQFAPSNWQVLGSASHGAPGFEAFAGYNFQFEKLVLGVEGTYDQASLSVQAPNTPISRLTPADSQGDSYLVNITGSGSLTQLDFATLRATAGWSLGNFLPYGFAGFALGHANINIAATVSGEQNPPVGRFMQRGRDTAVCAVLLCRHGRKRFGVAVRVHGRRRPELCGDAEHFPARRIRICAVLGGRGRDGGHQLGACRRRIQVLDVAAAACFRI